jgi:hypothetical protein
MYHCCNGTFKDVVFDHWDKTSVMQRRNMMTILLRISIHVAKTYLPSSYGRYIF